MSEYDWTQCNGAHEDDQWLWQQQEEEESDMSEDEALLMRAKEAAENLQMTRAKEVVDRLQSDLFMDLENPLNQLLVMAVWGFVGGVADQVRNKNVPEAFTGRDFRLCVARACRKIADDIQKEH